MNATSQENPTDISPPAEAPSAAASPSRLIDTLIFLLNFSVVTLFAVYCVISIGGIEHDPFEVIAVCIFLIAAVAIAVAEFCCWFLRVDWVLLVLGIMSLIFIPHLLFALVSSIIAKLTVGYDVSIWLLMLGGIAAAYLAYITWRRLRAFMLTKTSGTRS